MKLRATFRQKLGWKLFFSYLGVILVGGVVLGVAAEVALPAAYNRHMLGMMGHGAQGGMMGAQGNDFFTNFQAAFNEAFLLGTLSAVLAAGLASIFVTRRIMAPVQAMMFASQRVAEGKFEERIPIVSQPGHEDELASLARSFNHMAFRLEQTEAMRRQLIGDVAHELRTPLTTLKGSLEGLIDGVLEADEATFQLLFQETERLERLVQDLQELSRVEARAYELQLHALDLQDLIHRIVTRMKPQFDQNALEIRVRASTSSSHVLADEDRLIQVLTNLLSNALLYTPPGGQVEIVLEPKDGELQIQVRDTGIGIPADHLPYVFDRFYRVEKSRARVKGGSGIGLTIAKSLVEAQGGRIWVESAGVGKGSRFFFTLPKIT